MSEQDSATYPQTYGEGGLGPEDMAIPEIKLIQNVGGELAKAAGAQPGDFYSSLTDEVIKGETGFDMVIVGMQKSRTYWGRSDIMDEPPQCASLSAKSMLSINGDDCSKCPHRNEAPWLLTPTERREKCLIHYNILGILVDSSMPVLVRSSGISSQAAKEIYTQLAINKEIKGEWYRAMTHVSSVSKKSQSGEAYAMKFGKLQLLEEAVQIEEYRIQSAQLKGTPLTLPNRGDIEDSGPSSEAPVAEAPAAEAPAAEKAKETVPAAEAPEKAKETAPAAEAPPEKAKETAAVEQPKEEPQLDTDF